MVNGRVKGHSFERQLAQKFRNMGYPECCTSRSESKNLDDKGVDLFGLPINVQAKAVERFGKHHEVLKAMPQDGKLNFIFHKRNNKGTTVTMTEEDFWVVFTALKASEIIK